MSAHYINVGQGDAILLEFKKAAIFIDAGGEATGDTRDRDHLIDCLTKFFVRRTDLNRTLLAVRVSGDAAAVSLAGQSNSDWIELAGWAASSGLELALSDKT